MSLTQSFGRNISTSCTASASLTKPEKMSLPDHQLSIGETVTRRCHWRVCCTGTGGDCAHGQEHGSHTEKLAEDPKEELTREDLAGLQSEQQKVLTEEHPLKMRRQGGGQQ